MRRLGLLVAVAEQLLEHEGHVVHEVDRVVPDEHDPRPVGSIDVVVEVRLVDLDSDLGGAMASRQRARRSVGAFRAARDPSASQLARPGLDGTGGERPR